MMTATVSGFYFGQNALCLVQRSFQQYVMKLSLVPLPVNLSLLGSWNNLVAKAFWRTPSPGPAHSWTNFPIMSDYS